MLCVTGDLHHMSLGTNEQNFLPPGKTEIETGFHYLNIAEKYGIKTTLFITGKCFQEEWKQVKTLLHFQLNEIGGHTFNAFSPKLPYRIFNKLFGSFNGPKFVQRWDIQRTIDIIYENTGRKITSWRNHAYMHDHHTNNLLFTQNIQVTSDCVDPLIIKPYRESNGITVLPLNVIPDHEHLLHAHRTERLQNYIHTKYGWSDKFGWKAFPPKDWLKLVIRDVEKIENQDGIATVLMHPLCMFSADNFTIFEEFCRFASHRTTIFASEASTFVKNPNGDYYA